MSDKKLRGAAFHEAGHVIVARELGLPVGEIAVGIDGDQAKGRTDIGSAHHLPLIDQIALCVAGVVAQRACARDDWNQQPQTTKCC